jgi:transcriptional regulator
MTPEEVEEKVEDLVSNTLLAEREAEAYVYTEILDLDVDLAAERMETTSNNVSQKRHRFKEKIEKAERTAEL